MLALIAGPSGAGKDTLLALARQRLAGDPRVRFVRRVITRPADVGDEGHEAIDTGGFRRRLDEGDFALWWEAHALLYGIPVDIEADLAAGRTVVASVSRSVLRAASARYTCRVLEVTAAPDILARRLAARGREGAAEIAARLAREVPLPAGLDIVRIVNDGTPDEGANRLVSALLA